jgi:hypothetical protein
LSDLVCVQNQTVVTDAFKGEDLNHYVPVLKSYGVPILYNFRPSDMTWVAFRPKAKMHVLDQIFPEAFTSRTSSSVRTSSTFRPSSVTSTRRRPAR